MSEGNSGSATPDAVDCGALWWPLAAPGDLFDWVVAGKRLGDWLPDGGRMPQGVSRVPFAWFGAEDLRVLGGGRPGTRLTDGSGALLAHVEPVSAGGPCLEAVESRLVRHPWDLFWVVADLLRSLELEEAQAQDVAFSSSAHVEGWMRLGEGCRVLPGVVVSGRVLAGPGCVLGPNCFLRGDVVLGDGVRVGHGVEIKNSILGSGSAVSHLSYVGDSILGSDVNFGAGTMTANFRHDGANHRSEVDGVLIDTGRRKFGCVAGDGVRTGIHTGIYPGRKLGPGAWTRPGTMVTRDVR